MPDARRNLELLYARNLKESERSLSCYLEHVLIDSIPNPQPFGKIREQWQEQRDYWVVPALEYVAGVREEYNGPMNFWLGYSKGQDKTSYIGRILNWELRFAKKALRIYCGAKDGEQAGVILDCMTKEANLNPWFSNQLDFRRTKVVNKKSGSELHVLTSDAGGTQGKTPDIIVCDELTHWEDEEFFESLTSGIVKKGGRCVLIILTNAGFKDSWQDKVRQEAKKYNGTDWFFYEQPPCTRLASWIREEDIEKQRRIMTDAEARRLFDNEWIDLAQERGFISSEDVDDCIGHPKLPPKGAKIYLGIDFGGKIDRTALCALWFDGDKVHVIELDCWQNDDGSEMQITKVDEWIEKRIKKYKNIVCVFDKTQMLATIQRLEKNGVKVKRFEYKGVKQNCIMAENLRNLILNRKIVFAEFAGLLNKETFGDELKSLVVKRVQGWYRLDSQHNKHDDRTVSVGMAALEAIMTSPLQPAHQIPPPPKKPVSKKEIGITFNKEHFARRGYFGLR